MVASIIEVLHDSLTQYAFNDNLQQGFTSQGQGPSKHSSVLIVIQDDTLDDDSALDLDPKAESRPGIISVILSSKY